MSPTYRKNQPKPTVFPELEITWDISSSTNFILLVRKLRFSEVTWTKAELWLEPSSRDHLYYILPSCLPVNCPGTPHTQLPGINWVITISSTVWKYKGSYWLWPPKRGNILQCLKTHSWGGAGEHCLSLVLQSQKGKHVFHICLGMGKKNFSFHLISI